MTYGKMLEYAEADVLLPGHHRYKALTGHRKKGKLWMVQVLWEDNSKTWEPLSDMEERDHQTCLVYAIKNELLHTPGWSHF